MIKKRQDMCLGYLYFLTTRISNTPQLRSLSDRYNNFTFKNMIYNSFCQAGSSVGCAFLTGIQIVTGSILRSGKIFFCGDWS